MEQIKTIVDLVSQKKGIDIVVLDIRNLTIIADYFIICSATSTQMVKAICDYIEEKLADSILRIEGKDTYRWVVVDFGDIILHIFHSIEREFYNLERVWADAPKIAL